MINVCLIGNSHVANLKLALPAVQPSFPEIRTTFFASEGVSMELEIAGGKLVARAEHVRERMAKTSGTNGDIEPVYDAYVACGLTLTSLRAVRTYRATMDEVRASGRGRKVTVEDLAKGMERAVRASLAVAAISQLRQLTAAPIFFIATPHASYERHEEFWKQSEALNRIEPWADAFAMACDTVAEEYSAVFVPQPVETIGPIALTTRPEFYLLSPNEVRVENAHHAHMNAAFGAIVLRDVLERIAARLALDMCERSGARA